MIECGNGHFFNSAEHDSCPYCAVQGGSPKSSYTLNARNSLQRVIVLSDTEVAKVFVSQMAMEIESEKIKHANAVNSLFVKFVREDVDESTDEKLLVMERIYPYELRAFSSGEKMGYMEKFKAQLAELHDSGFVFGDFAKTRSRRSFCENVMLTKSGFRLVDAGEAMLRGDVGEKNFSKGVKDDLDGLDGFARFVLSF